MAFTRILFSKVPHDSSADLIQRTGQALGKIESVQGVYAGLQVEDSEMLQFMIHCNGQSAEVFDALSGNLPHSTVMDVEFVEDIDLTKALSAPVTEMVTFYFGEEAPSDYNDTVAKFRQLLLAIDGMIGSANGWALKSTTYQGVRGKAAVLAIGWSSVDAHMRFRETETFRDNIHLARNGAAKVEMHHVDFRKV